MARASSGAIGRTVSCSKRLPAGIGRVSVTMTSRAPQVESRSTAGPESTPWVAATMTSFAPESRSTWTALAMVPPVSIMSSTRTQERPSTSPTTRLATDSLGRVTSRVLWTKASGVPPSWLAQRSATRMRPASGETTAALPGSTRVRT